jgi:hypothetical protein
MINLFKESAYWKTKNELPNIILVGFAPQAPQDLSHNGLKYVKKKAIQIVRPHTSVT